MAPESLAPLPSPAARTGIAELPAGILLLELPREACAPCADPSAALRARVCEANEAALRILGCGIALDVRGAALGELLGLSASDAFSCELAREVAPGGRGFTLTVGAGTRVQARALRLADARHMLLVLEEPEFAPAGPHPSPPALVCRQLTRSIAHDMRSPMMAISGFAQVLGERHRAQVDADAQRCIDNIVAAAQRLERLLDALTEYARLGAGGLVRSPLDLCALIDKLCASRREGGLVFVFACDLPRIDGDPKVLRQVFEALLDHAYRHLLPGGAGEVRLFGRNEDGRARIRIQDAAAGQVTERGDGTLASLALALARRGIELHGGRLWSERNADGCETLEVDLPGLHEAAAT